MLAYKHLYHITAHSFYNLMTEGREFRLEFEVSYFTVCFYRVTL